MFTLHMWLVSDRYVQQQNSQDDGDDEYEDEDDVETDDNADDDDNAADLNASLYVDQHIDGQHSPVVLDFHSGLQFHSDNT